MAQLTTALIADDEAPMREQLRARLLEVWPDLQIVALAANGVEAVEMAARLTPQIVFLDIRMPGMGGIEAARQLYDRCHIVFVTAYDQYAVDAFEQGAIDYLLKPVTAERLATIIRNHLINIGRVQGPFGNPITILVDEPGLLGPENQADIDARKRAYFLFVRKALEDLRDSGKLAEVDVNVAAFSIIGMIVWMARWRRPGGPMELDEIVEQITRIALGGVLKD